MSDGKNPKKGVMVKTTNDISTTTPEIATLIDRKIVFFQDVIQKTILHVQQNKLLNILSIADVNHCIDYLWELSKKINDINDTYDTESVINLLQYINNELSISFKTYGTASFEDLLWVCFGNNSVNTYVSNESEKSKFDILKKYFHPINYRLIDVDKKNVDKQNVDKKNVDKKNVDFSLDKDILINESNIILEKLGNLETIDIDIDVKQFHLKVYGLQVIIHNPVHKKSLIITGVFDDIIVDILSNQFISDKIKLITDNIPDTESFKCESFERFVSSLTLKDLILNVSNTDFYEKYMGYVSNLNNYRQKTISQLVRDFISHELFEKRNIIIQLLIKTDRPDNQYLAYLLYDLLSNDLNGSIDTIEQCILFDSFPWSIKRYFKDAIRNTIQYTNNLTNYDIHKIPIEQQICLLNVNDSVKEKAMQKLKEVKAKSEDTGSKARQYLDGLLKVPFNIYKKENIMFVMNEIKAKFKNLVNSEQKLNMFGEDLENITSLEIIKRLREIKKISVEPNIDVNNVVKNIVFDCDKSELITHTLKINEVNTKMKLGLAKIKHSGKNKTELITQIMSFVSDCPNTLVLNEIFVSLTSIQESYKSNIVKIVNQIECSYNDINKYIGNVKCTLDNAVYGHDKAKNQIERIIGQWINGKQDGYCFGFEGPPGVGKTCLAKQGIANCLVDSEGNSRPFAMIQMGGDANGSSLHGHNYTYVGSTWGSIMQILIDKKCMNPIIFIDEIDKISKTEHGREIIGILTHLLDPSQNDCFQDKYFSGIDLDLSKALFILSYNDVDAIDRILLDRVHRIQFKNLTLDEKIVICKTHILPEIYKKMGLERMITIQDDTLRYIIDEYTYEPGVRKLKEVLFEVISEINLDILKDFNISFEIPINVTSLDIKNKYFKDKHEIKHQKIHTENKIGVISGLWANAMGKGGVIPIQSKWRPSDKFINLHLTGMQGDVMKESMNVALTLAWDLTNVKVQEKLKVEHNNCGIHIHCPEGATPKDGPSAGTAITTTLYSLLNNKKIKYDIAITGEITLDGKVTEIGGLDLKFIGGIKAGVTHFIYPKENIKDYNTFMEKYKDDELTKGIKFTSVATIEEVFEYVFE